MTALHDASLETWIRQYRPDANTPNITISYYLKGALAALYLDLALRHHTHGRESLATFMRTLWDRYGDTPYPESAFETTLIELGGPAIADRLAQYIHRTEPFDDRIWDTVGLQLERGFKKPPEERPVWLGLTVKESGSRLQARLVERDGPGEKAGISPDDELLALQGLRVTSAESLQDLLNRILPGEPVELLITHQGRVEPVTVTPESPRPDDYQLRMVDHPSEEQRQAFQAWLGQPLP